ncbi:g10334 [Coccomyxa elongata]
MNCNDQSRRNFVGNIGKYEAPCGYCHSGETKSLGMVANQMTCEAYQDLCNRGWRRSGTWLYRPLAEESTCTCVPHTIRLDVHKFLPSKAQKHIMRRFEKYLAGGPSQTKSEPPAPSTPPLLEDIPGPHTAAEDAAPQAQALASKKQRQSSLEERKRKCHLISPTPPASPLAADPALQNTAVASSAQVTSAAARVGCAINDAVRDLIGEGILPEACYPAAQVKKVLPKQRCILGPQAVFTTAAAFPIAAAARHASGSSTMSPEHLAVLLAARFEAAQAAEGHLLAESKAGHLNFKTQPGTTCTAVLEQPHCSPLAKASIEPSHTSRRGVHVDAGYGNAREGDASKDTRHEPAESAETPSTDNRGSDAGPGPGSRAEQTRSRHFETRLVPMPASKADLAAEYLLYRRYQVLHHKDSPDEVKESTFRRFLVDTPLVRRQAPARPDGQPPAWSFGSYHQQYWIDGELVAVAVLDVLPGCLSSVYFFWEPTLSFLTLGKVSALQEIAFVQAAASTCPSLHYYYMGYFIPSCSKMRYKAEFRPSDLLCMHLGCWVPAERAVPALDADMHCVISQIPGALQGLDASYIGSSAETSDHLSDAALAGTLLYLAGPQGTRRLVRLGQLARMNVPQETLHLLIEKLRSWRRLVGPGADQYVHVM